MSNLTKLPSSQEYNEGGLSDEIRLTFRRVRLRDGGSMAQELQDLEAKDLDLAVLPDGHLVASQADQVLWQLRPPPALRVLYTSGICSKDNYLSLLQRFGGAKDRTDVSADESLAVAHHPDPPIGAIAVLLLGPGRAALGLLRGLDRHTKKQPPLGWELEQHKVL